MQRRIWLRGTVVLALALCLAGAGSSQRGRTLGAPAAAGSPGNGPQPLTEQDIAPFPDPSGQDDTPLSVLAREARLRNEERQRHLALDTAKLVELSTLLQANVNRNGAKNVISLEDIRRTEEIEKLARKVRDRMRS